MIGNNVDSMKLFNIDCVECPRILEHLKDVRYDFPGYHARPVPAFGVVSPRLLIVGLGPGMHGANATGRPFTGDFAGILLYETLYKYGFSNKASSINVDDGLLLNDCRITNAVKCLPPANKPTTTEVKTCNHYLQSEIKALSGELVILALGGIAHNAVMQALKLRKKDYPFGHNVLHNLSEGQYLIDSYHCSRYNTQTKRLTEKMFHEVFDNIHELLGVTNKL